MQKTVTAPVICVLILLVIIIGIQSYALICCSTDEEAKMWIDRASLAVGIVVAALLCMSIIQLSKKLKDNKMLEGDDYQYKHRGVPVLPETNISLAELANPSGFKRRSGMSS